MFKFKIRNMVWFDDKGVGGDGGVVVMCVCVCMCDVGVLHT